MIKKLSLISLSVLVSLSVYANDQTAIDKVFEAVDLSSVTGFIGGAGATIVGIALALKGIGLAKRLVGKA